MRRTAVLVATAAALLLVPVMTAPSPAPDASTAAPADAGPPKDPASIPATPPAAAAGPAGTAAPAEVAGGAAALTTAEGFLLAPGGAAVGDGPVLRYTVEVDPATGLDPVAVAAVAETALGDVRSWARIRRLVRTDDPTAADARLLVAPPDVVDELCAEAGLDTAGVYSCWNGRFVALNAWRWATGAYGFPDVASYRLYLVNHEVGHVLGRGHVGCPGPGAVAPVMMQQSKGLAGCTANGWPYP